MNATLGELRIAAMAGLLAMALVHVAEAYPSRGGSCTACHGSSGSGSLTTSPNPLGVQLGNDGTVAFSVTSMGSSSVAAIAVFGLEDPALDASIAAGGGNWTHRVNSTYGQSYVSDDIFGTGPYTMNLAIGNAATPGNYPITVMFAGDGPVGKAYSPAFNLEIQAAGVAGDYNNDGTVDAADYTVWRDGLGTTYVAADYDVWKAHFGETAGFSAILLSAMAIPEPASLAILAVGVLAAPFWPRRPRSGPR